MKINAENSSADSRRYFLLMVLGALGVVYGDIGTSPLYAIRECFHGAEGVPPTVENVRGVLSLIFWSLVVVICVKYLGLVMRADNRGEGGVLALMALATPRDKSHPRWLERLFIPMGLFGAALLYGDGMITPAITVLSAVEGLKVGTPFFEPYVIPITIGFLILLFVSQRFGTARIGAIFGPVILLWFAVIGLLGLPSIIRNPSVLLSINPFDAIRFLANNNWASLHALGSVFLVVTGGEALYADMGHFGRHPIRWGWYLFAFPALLCNYFGQGALILAHPTAVHNPFFLLAPGWAVYPLVALATLAAVIASQAVISGSFSLTSQAVQLGYLPRVVINHTSSDEIGQVFVPRINMMLLIATVWLVLEFRSSSSLAGAYGVAVSTTMVITTLLVCVVASKLWRWNWFQVLVIGMVFLGIDSAFLSANLIKVHKGGWFPLAIGGVIFLLMTTWRRGRQILAERLRKQAIPFKVFVQRMRENPPVRVPGTAVYLTGSLDGTPPALIHNVKHNRVLHEQVIILMVMTESVPRVPVEKRVDLEILEDGFYRIIARYGFKDRPNVPGILQISQTQELSFNMLDVTYFLGRETLIASRRPGMAIWREKLFALMAANAQRANAFFRLPPEQVIEIGLQVEL